MGCAPPRRVLETDTAYLSRLANGAKSNPSDRLLRRMGLRKVVMYERVGMHAADCCKDGGKFCRSTCKRLMEGVTTP